MKLFLLATVRTNNFSDERMVEKIQGLWKEASDIITTEQHPVYGVYYEYESDYKGDYSLSVALEEDDNDAYIEILDTEKYKVFNVDSTDEEGVFKAWKNIWEQEEAGTLQRAYTYDFEKYDPNGNIDIYIAVK